MLKIDVYNEKEYRKLIKILSDICEYFKLVVPVELDEIPSIISNLKSECIDEGYTNTWPGTKVSRGRRKNFKEYKFSISNKSMDILKSYGSFIKDDNDAYISFDGYQIDISFYKDDNCVFYTTAHEGICMIDEKIML